MPSVDEGLHGGFGVAVADDRDVEAGVGDRGQGAGDGGEDPSIEVAKGAAAEQGEVDAGVAGGGGVFDGAAEGGFVGGLEHERGERGPLVVGLGGE